ncbi:MAG: hypothetical protein FWB87_13675 [Defluviitaleaceae bacterium]|nr:hypothetical protein [Defluviitaleaceae bacterium]
MDDKELTWSAHNECDHKPNNITQTAMEETEIMIRQIKLGVDKSPSYNSFAELLAEVDEEIATD